MLSSLCGADALGPTVESSTAVSGRRHSLLLHFCRIFLYNGWHTTLFRLEYHLHARRLGCVVWADTDTVTSCVWSPHNEMLSCGDDGVIRRFGMDGESLGELLRVDSPVTAMAWVPSGGSVPSDTFVAACVDGAFLND